MTTYIVCGTSVSFTVHFVFLFFYIHNKMALIKKHCIKEKHLNLIQLKYFYTPLFFSGGS
jgi:hypothetical protein